MPIYIAIERIHLFKYSMIDVKRKTIYFCLVCGVVGEKKETFASSLKNGLEPGFGLKPHLVEDPLLFLESLDNYFNYFIVGI